ncbi:MAG: formate dehydrogenase accessory protein FdhE, partial [Gammaproteobacteria bacterium]
PEPLPAPAALALAKQHAIPTFNARGWKRDASWRDALRQILARIRPSVRAPVVDLIARLETVDSVWLEDQANRILEGNPDELDRGMAVFIAAALQTYWVALVTRLDTSGFTRLDVPNICPCCGSRPVASVVRIGGAEANHRYLACSLCAAEWHLVRIKCANCDSTKGIRYYNIEGGTKAIQAEACTECDTYLKICYMTRDPQVEATADDLASLALDVLMAETTTLSRSGVNLLLFQGDGGGAG